MENNEFFHTIPVECPFCGEVEYLKLTQEEYERFKLYESSRIPVQNIFPDWPPEKRELLITGICPTCFGAMRFEAED